MLGGAGAGGAGEGENILTVTIARDEHGYGMKVSGDKPVYVQSVKEHGAAWRAGLRCGDRILCVDQIPVTEHTHQQVVHMIRANPTTVLTVQQNSPRHKTPITAPVPVNPEKQRQLEMSKVHTYRQMLEQEQKYTRDLQNELSKVPDVRKQAQLEAAEQRCAVLQHKIDGIVAAQTDNRGSVPVLHVRSQSSPEHLDTELRTGGAGQGEGCEEDEAEWRAPPPPGTPPPPYAHNTQPCADPQRAIISMEEDDSPASDNSTYSGLFSNLRSVRESKAKTAVLLNWLLGERRCACANLLLIITDGYRSATGVTTATLRRWAYEIHSTFLMPNAVLQLNGVDENMANEIEHVLVNEHDKEELLRNVFRKARLAAKEELARQLTEFQVKRQVGLGGLYGPSDAVLEKCQADKAQEAVVVERLVCSALTSLSRCAAGCAHAPHGADTHAALLSAAVAAALALHCRPAAVAAAAGGARASFLQREKLYKQRVKQLTKNHPQPFVVRGHHLQLQALTSVGHCHHCDLVIGGLAPQAAVCACCALRVHRACARLVDEGCCLDHEPPPNRISRLMERIHPQQANHQDSNDKKSRKASAASHFLNMERSFRKIEDEPPWDQTLTPASAQERRDESDESLYESADCHSDAISASDDALPRLSKTPTMSKESLKLAVTDEEVDLAKTVIKKGHRKTMSLSYPLEIVKNLGDEWFDNRKDIDKNVDKRKSKESLWSEEDRDSVQDTVKIEPARKNSKKESKSESNSRKSSAAEIVKPRKSSKSSSVSALNFLRRKKTSVSAVKAVEAVAEVVDKELSTEELLNYTRLFLEEEKRYSALISIDNRPVVETDTDDDVPTPKLLGEHRRRLSRQTSRSKSKARGKSQSVKVNTLRKSHSGTLKKSKKKPAKTPSLRSRQSSVVEATVLKKNNSVSVKQNSWLFSGSRGEPRREGSTEEAAPTDDADANDAPASEHTEENNSSRLAAHRGLGRGVSRAESCRERDAPRRGKHRNASDPNRLTAAAHNHHDLEPGAATAPSGSSSSSSLSSRSNESNTVAAEQHASQSDWSDEDEPLASVWADSLPPHVLDSLALSSRLRKRQEVIHELIVSEGSHVRWLRVLGSVFLRPLERSGLLPAEELRALLPNLPQVRERHGKLYSDLKALRSDPQQPIVPVRPVADALLNTLGESGYASCLARFCRGQRMALEALRERRRKSKELHQWLATREQLPLCARLQLRDLLACVWQRLTKYQLLLESILKTVSEDPSTPDADSADDIAALRRALAIAKDVLHTVDTAIRTAENEHRLRAIQSKLEVRVPAAAEWEELRRLDLTNKRLRMEGELSLRHDTNKKILGLLLEDALVLLAREGERYVLKPLSPPSHHAVLSPLIKWEKVLFRPNAAVKNTFLLININGVQMHELSANTAAEYALWVRHISELPLAKPELRPTVTPHHHASRSNDDSGINVSRNPSDASEKSTSSAPDDEERDRHSADRASDRDRNSADRASERDRTSMERSGEEKRSEKSVEREERKSIEKEEKEEKHKPRRPTVGRISTHGAEPPAAVTVCEPVAVTLAHTAETALTYPERLRRLDDTINRALRSKSAIVGELLGLPRGSFAHMADLAVAESLGDAEVCNSLSGAGDLPAAPDVHQLLLAAHAQANQLIETLSKAMNVNEAAVVARRARGRCDSCRKHAPESLERNSKLEDSIDSADKLADASIDKDLSFDLLPDLDTTETNAEDALESNASAAALAVSVSSTAGSLAAALGRALAALPAAEHERARLRQTLAVLREENDSLRALHCTGLPTEISYSKDEIDPSIQDQPSNGG